MRVTLRRTVRREPVSDAARGSARRRACGDERGPALVEFSIVAVLLLALVFGTFTVGSTYSKKLSMRTASREAARYGATLPTSNYGSTNAWLDAVAVAAAGASGGDWKATDPNAQLCVALVTSTGTATERVQVGSVVSYGSAQCMSDGLAAETRVQVTMSRTSSIDAVFFRSTPTLRASAVARAEAAS